MVSLVVALYAIKLASGESNNEFTFGWQRAEVGRILFLWRPPQLTSAVPILQVLGALINGVFLLALCFSIFLEALQRFFEVPGRYLDF